MSPYTADLDWNEVNDLDEIRQLVRVLGRCVAKIHCCSDIDSDQTLVPIDEFADYVTGARRPLPD